jgi:MFS family permease
VQFVPVLALTLVGGAGADRFERRRIIMIAQLVPMTCALALMGSTVEGWVTLPVLYGAVFVAASAGAFENPARAALLPMLVPRGVFPRAVTLASTGQALAFMSGPAAGGFVIASRNMAPPTRSSRDWSSSRSPASRSCGRSAKPPKSAR